MNKYFFLFVCRSSCGSLDNVHGSSGADGRMELLKEIRLTHILCIHQDECVCPRKLRVLLSCQTSDVEYGVKQYMVIVNDITHVDFSAKNCLNYFDFIE